MINTQILDPNESYTFSRYAELSFDTADILAAFEVGLVSHSLQLPQQLPIDPNPLRSELEENLTLVDPSSEIAHREALIFPVLKTVCKFTKTLLKIEYPIRVNNWLKGSFDYFLPGVKNLVVIGAKNADLFKGFTQLAIELIALDQWTSSQSERLYGSVTTGDTWKFGFFDRTSRTIHKDINTYGVPSDLNQVLSILFGISL